MIGGVCIDEFDEVKKLLIRSDSTLCGNETLQDLFDHYGIEEDISNYLRKEICVLLRADPKSETLDLTTLRNHSILDHFFNESDVKFCSVLAMIWDVARQFSIKFVSLDKEDKWLKAIELALDYNKIYPDDFKPTLGTSHLRLYNQARSALYFKNKGFDVQIKDAKVILENNSKMQVVRDIENDIRRLGGLGVINSLFNNIQVLFDERLNRFHINRIIGYNNGPLIPFTYLLNLAIKYTKFKESRVDLDKTFKRVLTNATHLMVIYDTQPFNVFHLLFFGNFIHRIQEIALFDSIYTINQFNTSYIETTLIELFDWTKDKIPEDKFDLKQIMDVITRIMELSPNNSNSLIFKVEDLRLERKYPLKSLKQTLIILSNPEGTVNKGYCLPEHYEKIDFNFKPLIKRGNIYLLANLHWCSTAFYEAIADHLRSICGGDKIQEHLGTSFQNCVKTELKKKNISFSSGNYDMKINGECDVVIETNEAIIFIEQKVKSLTNKAKSGKDISLVMDITRSLLKTQKQLGHHENTIKKYGYIKLEGNQLIELKGRTVYRVSLSLLDYGGFHDKKIVNDMLEALSRIKFNLVGSGFEEEIKMINKDVDKFQEKCAELTKLDTDFKKRKFYNCLFISLPIFLMLLNNSKDNESFFEQLKMLMYITHGSLDPYYEYSLRKGYSKS